MDIKDKIELMVNYAYYFIKTPYKWGGDDFTGMDCSGFIQEVLASVGWDPPADQTAQALYNFFAKSWYAKLDKGALIFFGQSTIAITHVALALNSTCMIEAGGGGQNVLTVEAAAKYNAYIRIRPISKRSDLVAYLYPR